MEEVKQAKLGKISDRAVWDCGSSLYDSFEREAVQKQLDAAITAAGRTISMPHLEERVPPGKKEAPAPRSARSSFGQLIRSIFGMKKKNGSQTGNDAADCARGSYEETNILYGELSTIQEAPEMDEVSPLARRTASERYGATAVRRKSRV